MSETLVGQLEALFRAYAADFAGKKDVGVWVFLPATTWLEFTGRVAATLTEDLQDDPEPWEEPPISPEDAPRYAQALLVLDEALLQCRFPDGEWRDLLQEARGVIRALVARLGAKPDAPSIARALVLRPEIIEVFRKIMREVVKGCGPDWTKRPVAGTEAGTP